MRLQPLNNAHVHASVSTSASTVSQWLEEWLKLISYGPTYNKLEWSVPAQGEETIRVQMQSPMVLELKWSDQSVSWEKYDVGRWMMDISKTVDVTLYLKADVGEYVKQHNGTGPAAVKAIQLKPYLEIACDDDIPFTIEKNPVANMYWSSQINVKQLVNPERE
tara:strand:+ start:8233 stop:8721 length:489 start_codon:yes stop_codon:yes gene_type:complete